MKEELSVFNEPGFSGIGFVGYISGPYPDNVSYTHNRYLSNLTGRFMSVDPSGSFNLHDPRTFNQYAYVAGNPLTFVDPFGLRYVDVYIWEWKGIGKSVSVLSPHGSVGHVMVTEHDSTAVLLSQFPPPGESHGENKRLSFAQTLVREGRPATNLFVVFVPDDAAFDQAIKDQQNRPYWDWDPDSPNETHCARAVYDALKAGGVPVSGQDTGQILPGTLEDILAQLTTEHTERDKWSVEPTSREAPQAVKPGEPILMQGSQVVVYGPKLVGRP